MKKNVIVMLYMSTAFLHGMENTNSFAREYFGTLIRVTKGKREAIYEEDGKVDIIIVGQNEQQQLNKTIKFNDLIGNVSQKKCNSVYIIKKESDSFSNDDLDNPTKIMTQKNHNFYQKDMQSYIFTVIEPCMYNPYYDNKIENYFYNNKCGNDAIKNASADLALCYKNILNAGLQKLKAKKEKSIAIPLLTNTLCFHKSSAINTTLTSILTFVRKNKELSIKHGQIGYALIHLFIDEESDLIWYKKIITAYRDNSSWLK